MRRDVALRGRYRLAGRVNDVPRKPSAAMPTIVAGAPLT